MMDSLQISEYGCPFSRSTSMVAIMVAMYTPAVKGLSGILDSSRLARTSWPTWRGVQRSGGEASKHKVPWLKWGGS